MFPIKISETDKLGVMYIILNNIQLSDNDKYFNGIEKLQSFLRSKELESYLTGFYLSIWNNSSIRFSYFTKTPRKTPSFLDEIFTSLGFVKFLPDKNKKPHDVTFSSYHGKNKTDLEFRKFLQLITNIGLDFLNWDILYSRRLVAKYRLEIAPLGVSCKSYFTPAFKKIPYYNSLTSKQRKELFDGLDYWHTSWEDWAHMFVVMLLPGDWIYFKNPLISQAFNPRRPIDKSIHDLLSKGFLPNNWQQ